MYNCCQITRGGNLTICDDYSSVVVKFAPPAVIVIFSLSFFMVIPFVLEHIITCPTMKFYKTSDSPMSLYISILSMMFFEGRGPAISLFRRCVFALLSYVVFCPNFFGSEELQIAFWVWAGVFLITDEVQMTHEKCKMKCAKPKWDKNVISCFKIPFILFCTPGHCAVNDVVEGDCVKRKCYAIVSYLWYLIYGFIICVSAIVYL
jgi:hypothetical protein